MRLNKWSLMRQLARWMFPGSTSRRQSGVRPPAVMLAAGLVALAVMFSPRPPEKPGTRTSTASTVPAAEEGESKDASKAPPVAKGTQIPCEVVGVHDGDTITVLDGAKTQRKVRMQNIDAPELSQAYGRAAREAMASMVMRQQVILLVTGTDRYGRTLGIVQLKDGRVANTEMVRQGMAWHYRQYSKSAELDTLQQQARDAKIGLWAEASPTPPWDYRRTKKSAK